MPDGGRRTAFFSLAGLLIGGAALLLMGTRALSVGRQNPSEFDLAAPELVGGPWLNTPKNAPIKLASRKGKVTVVEFWTFG